MVISTIDTHEVGKELKAAGFTDDQAKAMTRLVRRPQAIDLSNLVTEVHMVAIQVDLTTIRESLQRDIASTNKSLRRELARIAPRIAETKSEILNWMNRTIGLQTVVILGSAAALAGLIPG